MRAILETKMMVQVVQAWAELSFFEKRPEIAQLCRAADEHGGLDEYVVSHTLPGLSERAVQRLILSFRKLKLCSQDGSLTKWGLHAARNGDVPIPEQGIYRFALIEHNVTGPRIIHVERLRPSDMETSINQETSDLIMLKPGSFFRSIVPKGPTGILRSQFTAAQIEEVAELDLQWTLNFDKKENHLKILGCLPQRFRAYECLHQGESVELDLDTLLTEWNGTWMENRWNGAFYEVTHEEVQEGKYGQAAIKSLQTFFELPEVSVLYYGVWSGHINGVPIGPQEKRDGEKWARFLLLHQLNQSNELLSWEQVRERYRQLVEESTLKAVKPEVPGFAELWCEARDMNPTVAMRLAASVDLAPFILSENVIAPRPWIVEDVASDKFTEDRRENFSLSPGVRLPMRTLIQKILRPVQGQTIQRVLYVDRYATKKRNLPNLSALAACLAVPLDVVSDQEVNCSWQGQLFSFTEFFGQGPRKQYPHDRYLLVRTSQETIVWHLSNALLDGRTDDGKASANPDQTLKWRDLSAQLEDYANLPQAMRNWVKGGYV